jgi:hypothetical protein
MADSVINVASKSIKLIDNGDGTYSLASAGVDRGAIQGLVTSGTVTTLQDSSKNLLVNSLQGKSVKIIIDGVEYIREIISNTADTLTFANIVAKVAATAVVEKAGAGKVTITAVPEGDYANDYEVVVVDGVGPSADTEAAFANGVLTITLGTDAGTAASVTLGSGDDGTLTITRKEAGVSDYFVSVAVSLGTDSPMSVQWTGDSIGITLGTDGTGAPDNAKNTVALIADAINNDGQLGALFTAVASGQGTGALDADDETVQTDFAGGVDPVVNATAADVAAEVDALTGFSAVVDSAGLLEALVDPVAFSGGVDEIAPGAGDEYFVFDGESVSLSGSKVEQASAQDTQVATTAKTYTKAAGASQMEVYCETGYIRVRTDGEACTSTTGEPIAAGFGSGWQADSISVYFIQESVITVVSR